MPQQQWKQGSQQFANQSCRKTRVLLMAQKLTRWKIQVGSTKVKWVQQAHQAQQAGGTKDGDGEEKSGSILQSKYRKRNAGKQSWKPDNAL